MRKTLFALTIVAALVLGVFSAAPSFADDKDKKDKKDKAMKSADPKSLYARLGGKKAIKAVVDEFVNIVAADTRINKFFADAAGDPKRTRQIQRQSDRPDLPGFGRALQVQRQGHEDGSQRDGSQRGRF